MSDGENQPPPPESPVATDAVPKTKPPPNFVLHLPPGQFNKNRVQEQWFNILKGYVTSGILLVALFICQIIIVYSEFTNVSTGIQSAIVLSCICVVCLVLLVGSAYFGTEKIVTLLLPSQKETRKNQ